MSESRTYHAIWLKFALALAGCAVTIAVIPPGTTAARAGQRAGHARALRHSPASGTAGPAYAVAMAVHATAGIAGGRPATGTTVHTAPGHATPSGAHRAARARAHHVARPHAPKAIARALLHRFGWSRQQFWYLNRLWDHESGWNRYASNPGSGAYGIPQAVPGSKMASAGPNWQSNARTQIIWGLRYIRGRYGTPRQAWEHELGYGWY